MRLSNIAKEWNVIFAILAVLSLPFMLIYAPTKEKFLALEQSALNEIREGIKSKDFTLVESHSRDFIESYPDSKDIGEVYYALAISILEREEPQKFHPERLGEAVQNLQLAEGKIGYSKDIENHLLNIASIYRNNKHFDKALEIYYHLKPNAEPTIVIEIALTLGSLPVVSEEDITERITTSFRYIDEFLQSGVGKPEDNIYANLAKSEILTKYKKYEGALEILDIAEQSYQKHTDIYKLYLKRGRLLLLLGKLTSAEADFNNVIRIVEKGIANEEGRYFLCEVKRLQDVPEAIGILEELITLQSKLAPLAHISLAKFHLKRGKRKDTLEQILTATRALKDLQLIEEYNVDLQELFTLLKVGWDTEDNEQELLKYVYILNEFERLKPQELLFKHNIIDIYNKIASSFMQKYNEELIGGDDISAREFRLKADSYYLKIAEKYIEISKIAELSEDEVANAHKMAGNAFFNGRYYVKSADNYGIYLRYFPRAQDITFKQAMSLKLAKVYEVADKPDALDLFEKCISEFPKNSAYTINAIIERARILEKLGRYEQAIADLDTLLKDEREEHGITPESDEWKEALFLKGSAYFNLGKRLQYEMGKSTDNKAEIQKRITDVFKNANNTFAEFLNRYVYGDSVKPHSYGLNCIFYMAKLYADNGQWNNAINGFKELIELSGKIKDSVGKGEEDVTKLAYFCIGDMYYNSGDYKSAIQAYEIAHRKYVADKDRIWGLIGTARCYLRLNEKDKAMELLEDAKSTFKDNEKAYDEDTPTGFGSEYWRRQIEIIEKG